MLKFNQKIDITKLKTNLKWKKVRASRGTEQGRANTLLKKEKKKDKALNSPFFSLVNNSLVDLTDGKSPFLINIARKK